ncbi:diguanylate cyclase [Paenibacillus sp. sgz500958]|uniref:sensor domain-containing diguanylate cyclase n=1 Tax=Paenibacillus sp. sgz500958 TaxID=3242475 RepID=UPI0036D3FC74
MPWMQGYPYYLVMGSMLSLYMGIGSHKSRKTPGRRYLWILMFIVSVIFMATAAEIMSAGFSAKLWWRNIQQIPLFFSTLFTYAVIKDYVAKPAGGISRRLALFSIPVILDILLIFTDSYHHLMRSSVGMNTVHGISGIEVHPTVLSMLLIAYDQLFGVYAVVLLATSLFSAPRHYLGRHLLMLSGLMVPVISIFLLPVLKITITGFTAITMLPATLAAYLTLFSDPRISIFSLAKHKIFENMKNGIILTDIQDRIIDINDAGETMISHITGHFPHTWIGQDIHALLNSHHELKHHYVHKTEGEFEIDLSTQENLCYGVSLVPTERDQKDSTGMLIIISDHSAKKRYERELVHQATIDDLTGLYNRRHFMRSVHNHGLDGGAGMALLLIDIDDFKLINDTYGHLAGDQALVVFSERVQRMYKDRGIAGRVGGEEFAICFFSSDEEAALMEAETFRKTMGKHVVTLDGGVRVHLTVSVGVAYTEGGNVTFEELYGLADDALYISKTTGKNKVTLGEWSVKLAQA